MDTHQQRLSHYLSYQKLTPNDVNDIAVQKKVKPPKGTIFRYVNAAIEYPRLDFLLSILKIFPKLNPYWWLYGEGDMELITVSDENSTEQSYTLTVKEKEYIEKINALNETVKSTENSLSDQQQQNIALQDEINRLNSRIQKLETEKDNLWKLVNAKLNT